ncbi:nucleotide sugar dehydrogenase [Actinomadura litoris]|uniref:nucleotide sugar dehydrogenase n=1 Tax=Actinomadura litoris TaxID=2678616 RepID=UPI001FA7295F|nr:nucleotide sugar dehydrogenase [Actinomadura litoris]
MPDRQTIAVIGLGYVGLCVATALTDAGFDIIGVDNDPDLVADLGAGVVRSQEPGVAGAARRALDEGRLRATTDYAAVAEAPVVLIAVGTPITDAMTLAEDQLRGACTELARHLRKGQLVICKSTVPPGTTRELVLPLLEAGGLVGGRDFLLAFSPERLAEGTALTDLRTLPIVVGGLDERSTTEAMAFWQKALNVQVIPQDSLESAEIVKLADNWWIDLNIALANELAQFCSLFGVDVLDVIAAANSITKGKGSVNILMPSVGVGGSCLTKDPWMVWQTAASRGLEIHTPQVGRQANAGMPAYTARLILDDLRERGKDPAESTVAILGLAFKNNTGDLRATPVRDVVAELLGAGVAVRSHDPLVDPDQAERLVGTRPAESLEDTVRDADCVAVLALHERFAGIDFAALPVAASCLLLDGRAYYSKEKIAMLRELGYRYRGIGR